MTHPAPSPVEVIDGPESYIKMTVDPSVEPPALMLHANGDIYVKGRLAANDQEIVDGLREFMEATRPTVATVNAAMATLTSDERMKVVRMAIECEDEAGRLQIVRRITGDPESYYHPSYE